MRLVSQSHHRKRSMSRYFPFQRRSKSNIFHQEDETCADSVRDVSLAGSGDEGARHRLFHIDIPSHCLGSWIDVTTLSRLSNRRHVQEKTSDLHIVLAMSSETESESERSDRPCTAESDSANRNARSLDAVVEQDLVAR